MSKLTVHEDAKDVKLAPAQLAKVTVKDALGRTLTIQEPSILDESRLVRALGEAALNQAYMVSYALPAAMVVDVDGEFMHVPVNQAQLDGRIQMLGREGMKAVMDYVINRADAAEGGQETVKKSQPIHPSGTPAG